MSLEYDEVLKRVFEFITWKNLEDGRKADLHILEESCKEILFADWDSRIRQAEKATTITTATTNCIIESINEYIQNENLVVESVPSFLPNVKQLEQQWR